MPFARRTLPLDAADAVAAEGVAEVAAAAFVAVVAAADQWADTVVVPAPEVATVAVVGGRLAAHLPMGDPQPDRRLPRHAHHQVVPPCPAHGQAPVSVLVRIPVEATSVQERVRRSSREPDLASAAARSATVRRTCRVNVPARASALEAASRIGLVPVRGLAIVRESRSFRPADFQVWERPDSARGCRIKVPVFRTGWPIVQIPWKIAAPI